MRISEIKSGGNDTILRWAIKNGANPGNDQALANLLQEELLFQVTYQDINFFELFRITQALRDKVIVKGEYPAEIPSDKELSSYFPGETEVEGSKFTLAEIVKSSIEPMYNISKQMLIDNDIISSSVQESFIPMMCRKFDIIVSFTLFDLLPSMSEEDCKLLFTNEYPNTLNLIVEKPMNNIINNLSMAFVQLTDIIRYSERFTKYINATKYKPLLADDVTNEIYKIGLLGCHKKDTLTNKLLSFRTVPVINTPEENKKILHSISMVRSPLYTDLVIQLPMNYMQKLENTFNDYELPISYESSMRDIIDTGVDFNSFITPIRDEKLSEEQNKNITTEFENKISDYKIRIKEAINKALIGMGLLIPFENKIGFSNSFAILPSIFNTKAVITVDNSKQDEYMDKINNPINESLFKDIFNISNELSSEIKW